MGWLKKAWKKAKGEVVNAVTNLNPIEQTKSALKVARIVGDEFGGEFRSDVEGLWGRAKGWADDQIGETRREHQKRKAEAQLRANSRPDDFDVLLREAAFSAAKQENSALSRTFATTPGGIEGPAGKMTGRGGLLTGDVNLGDFDEEDLMIGLNLGGGR